MLNAQARISLKASTVQQAETPTTIAQAPCGAQLFVRWFWQAQRAFVTQRTAPVSVHGDTGATRAGMQSPAAKLDPIYENTQPTNLLSQRLQHAEATASRCPQQQMANVGRVAASLQCLGT